MTTDNASSNKKMMAIVGRKLRHRNEGFSARRHVPCVSHIVNIVVQAALKNFAIPSATPISEEESDVCMTADQYDSESQSECDNDDNSMQRRTSSLSEAVFKVRTIVRAIRRSTKRRMYYVDLCKTHNLVPRLPSLDCPTRWNSTHTMLEEAIEKREVIDAGAAFFTTGGSQTKVSREEWELLKEFSFLLGPFAYTTDHVSRSTESVVGDVLLLVRALTRHMMDVMHRVNDGNLFAGRRVSQDERASLLAACTAMQMKLTEYEKLLWDNDAILVASLLDPFRKGSMFDEAAYIRAVAYVRQILPATPPVAQERCDTRISRPQQASVVWVSEALLPKKAKRASSQASPLEEFESFLRAPQEEGDSARAWWGTKGVLFYPTLVKIAREFLSVSATSAPSERLFSAGRAVVTYERSRLEGPSIEALVCIKCWSRAENRQWYDTSIDGEIEAQPET